MSHPSESHVGPAFVKVFGECLEMLRQVFQTSDKGSQPFILNGSGTLGWDFVAANLVEPGDDVLVLHTGYFSNSFAECFETYGMKALQVKAPVGQRPSLEEVEDMLKQKAYKMITITHCDTSTGVLSDIKAIAELVRRISPNTLIVVDGVCSVGCEDIQFDSWALDLVLTGSQKALGAPAGLSIIMASKRAISVYENRKSPPASYYASMKKWLPIMQNYEARRPSYFATPAVQIIHALNQALKEILKIGMQSQIAQHKETSTKVKSKIAAMGLKTVCIDQSEGSNGMTAVYLPPGVQNTDLLPKVAAKGVIFAAGLHKEIATKYFRIGHMGVSVTRKERGDIDQALKALQESLNECGYVCTA